MNGLSVLETPSQHSSLSAYPALMSSLNGMGTRHSQHWEDPPTPSPSAGRGLEGCRWPTPDACAVFRPIL